MKQASKNLNNNLAQQGNHYLIPKQSGKPIALVMAIFMHGLLFLFLWIGIRWQSQTPDTSTRNCALAVAPNNKPATMIREVR